MTANAFVFTIEIGGTPTLTFEAQNLREAHELCHEQWLKDDLAEAKSNGVPLWDGKAKLRARVALPEESVLFAEAKNNGQPCDDVIYHPVREIFLFRLGAQVGEGENGDRGFIGQSKGLINRPAVRRGWHGATVWDAPDPHRFGDILQGLRTQI